MSFYAVAKGRQIGIYPTWAQCEAQVKSYPGAQFKKFSSQHEATQFICTSNPNYSQSETQEKNVSAPNTNLFESTQLPSTSKTPWLTNSSQSFYAVAKGKNIGIFSTWMECKSQIDGIKYPKYRKFSTYQEAEEFINQNQTTTEQNTSNRRIASEKTLRKVPSVPSDNEISNRSLSVVTFRNCNFQQDADGFVHCYTDGSCEGNGQNGARAGVGVWFAVDHPLNVSEPVVGPPTNNVAEIQAATKAIRVAQECGITKLQINTDSQFLIKCITQWMPNWKRNGWKLSTGGDVKNREQLEELHSAMEKTTKIKWNYVKAHKGIEGNEHADRLAKAGAADYVPKSSSYSAGSKGVRFKPY